VPPFTNTIAEDRELNGGNILARWRYTFSARADMTAQFYYDRSERQASDLRESRDTADFDFHHRFAFGKRHEVIWGVGYRVTSG
jgi:iron complex outermembrane receptor protein